MEEITTERPLSITDEALVHLDVARKWTMFLAVVGFIGSGLLVLLGLFFTLIMQSFGRTHEFGSIVPILLGVLYVVLGVAYCIPSYFLLRFSTNVKSALASRTDEPLTTALRYLRTFFAFLGGTVIAIIVLYILIIAGAVLFGVFSALHHGAPQT